MILSLSQGLSLSLWFWSLAVVLVSRRGNLDSYEVMSVSICLYVSKLPTVIYFHPCHL